MNKVDSFNKASVIFVLSVVLGTVAYAWTGAPAGIPPANNVSAPVNVGTVLQEKLGPFKVRSPFTITGGNKGYSALTQDADDPSTLVTKSYVDSKVSKSVSSGGFPINCKAGLITDINGNVICDAGWSTTATWGSCSTVVNTTTHNEIVYNGSDGCGQRVTKSYTQLLAQTRVIPCVNSLGQTISDSLCTQTKPPTTQNCGQKIRYVMWANDMNACGGGAGPARVWKVLDPRAGSYSWYMKYYNHGFYSPRGSGDKADGVTSIKSGVNTHQGMSDSFFDLIILGDPNYEGPGDVGGGSGGG